MPVGVDEVNLKRPVWPLAAGKVGNLIFLEVALPGVHVVDHQGPVVAAIVRDHRARPFPNEMQLLVSSQPEPCAGEGEVRAGHRLQLEYLGVKLRAPLEVGDVQGDVIELQGLHRRILLHRRAWRLPLAVAEDRLAGIEFGEAVELKLRKGREISRADRVVPGSQRGLCPLAPSLQPRFQ